MATIYFLLFIAVCVLGVLWATHSSKPKTDLAANRKKKYTKAASEKLVTPADSILSHKEEIWQKRRKHATKGASPTPSFIPKSVAAKKPEYDGYSRRDRHHVTPEEQVKKEAHVEDLQMTSIEFDEDKLAPPSQRTH